MTHARAGVRQNELERETAINAIRLQLEIKTSQKQALCE
jgi:hypothetical protein